MTALIPPFHQTIIAHRGAAGYAPENTIRAFNEAFLRGAKWVEFDVMLAACGTPIVFHDETLNRTTNALGDIGAYTCQQLQTLDAGAWFASHFASERIPTFETVLHFLLETGMSANIELKPLPGQERQTVENALKIVNKLTNQNNPRLLFSSFSLPTLHILREHASAAHLGLLMHEWLPHWKALAKELYVDSIHVNEEILTPDAALEIKQLNKILLCYTVNSQEAAKRFFAMGVDGVFSDYPDLLGGG
jgi:glycerophosphoryl diester phosphodiesterase